jgi:hypothetical protein
VPAGKQGVRYGYEYADAPCIVNLENYLNMMSENGWQVVKISEPQYDRGWFRATVVWFHVVHRRPT